MLQFFANGLIAGSVYALIALGFALIYSTVRFFHFAHGAMYTTGAYLAFTFFILCEIPFILSVGIAIFLTALLGMGIGICVYEPMRRRGASSFVLLIASLGLFILLQNLISLIFGDDVKTIRRGAVQEGYHFLDIRITNIQIIIIIASLILFIITTLVLKHTKIGKALRAVANDYELAIAAGINTPKVVNFTYFMGSALAAIAAILISLDLHMTPMMGFNAILYGIIAMIIGGLGNILGAYFGGLFLGLSQHLGVVFISSKWQDAIAFSLLIIFLLFRPQGFFGKRIERAQI